MNRKLTAALCCAATATLALAGCGSSSAKAHDYAKKVCDLIQPQQQKIVNANAAISAISTGSSTPVQVKQIDSTAFGQMSDAYRGLARSLRDAGPPPVKNGSTLQEQAETDFLNRSAAYSRVKKTVDGLNTSDQGKFATSLQQLSNTLVPLNKSVSTAFDKIQSGTVGKEMDKQPGCQKPAPAPTIPIQGSGTPTPSGTAAPSTPAPEPSVPAKTKTPAAPSASAKPSETTTAPKTAQAVPTTAG